MCYDIDTIVFRAAREARRQGDNSDQIDAKVRDLLEHWYGTAYYHVSGFDHPWITCVTEDPELKLVPMQWGLVPPFAKKAEEAVKWRNQTLNARSETMFSKPSFRHAARSQRCLIPVSGFFEHHHTSKRSIPFHVQSREHEILLLGGIWESWDNPASGQREPTFSIVTTAANDLLAPIHNHGKTRGPRMPLILDREAQKTWLDPSSSEEDLLLVSVASSRTDLEAYPVSPLRGKNASPNGPEALQPRHYAELDEQGKLF